MFMIKRVASLAFVLAVILISPCAVNASELSVEEAYQAIPHKRTVFDVRASTLSAAQSNALKQLFELADRGIVLRVQGLRTLQSTSNSEVHSVLLGYRSLINAVASLRVPAEISPAQDLMMESIQLHQQFFETQFGNKQSGGKADVAVRQNREVNQASQKLIAAYGSLIKAFPGEPAVNRQAFYDYLCALDFL
jgi:hypothetical protein